VVTAGVFFVKVMVDPAEPMPDRNNPPGPLSERKQLGSVASLIDVLPDCALK